MRALTPVSSNCHLPQTPRLFWLAIIALCCAAPLAAQSPKFVFFDAPNAGTGGTGTFPYSINDGGQVAGTYVDSAGVWHGFLRDATGNYTILDAPNAGTGINQGTFAKLINANGQIAGYYADANTVYHGFIR